MFYKYEVSYSNGTKLSGYAYSDEKSMIAVRMGIERKFFGMFTLKVKKYGEKFPPINSDYILTV